MKIEIGKWCPPCMEAKDVKAGQTFTIFGQGADDLYIMTPWSLVAGFRATQLSTGVLANIPPNTCVVLIDLKVVADNG